MPVPRVVSTIVGIEHIVSGVLQIFRRFFTFFHVASDLGIFFSRHRAHTEIFRLRDNGVAQGNRIIIATGSLDLLYDRRRKPIPVLERAAELIRPVIRIFECELI